MRAARLKASRYGVTEIRVGALSVRTRWIALSVASGVLMAAASAAGIYVPDVYAKETASWAAQGVGQDVVNVLLVFPALLAAAYFVARGSWRALLVWVGLLIYIIYSYVLYTFFVHFNRLFLVYVSVLGLSFWALAGASVGLSLDRLTDVFDRDRAHAAPAVYLMASALLFGVLWLSDIVPAVASGTVPRGVTDVGLPVNPIHVLDLAFVLPAMAVTSVSLWRRRRFGLFFAAPLMTFAAVMGAAIVSMSIVLQRRSLVPDARGTVGLFVVLIAIALVLTFRFLRSCAFAGAPASTRSSR